MTNIHTRLAAVTKQLAAQGIEKGQKGAQGYNYRGIEQALAAANKALTDNGLHMVINTRDEKMDVESVVLDQAVETVTEIDGDETIQTVRTKLSKVERWYTLSMTMVFRFYDEDGGYVEASIPGIHSAKEAAKLSGQLTSYLTKEMLFKMFLIPVKGMEDIDSVEGEQPAVTKTAAKRKTTKKTPAKAKPAAAPKEDKPETATPEEYPAPVSQGNDRKLVVNLLLQEAGMSGQKEKTMFLDWNAAFTGGTLIADMADDEWVNYLNTLKTALEAKFA